MDSNICHRAAIFVGSEGQVRGDKDLDSSKVCSGGQVLDCEGVAHRLYRGGGGGAKATDTGPSVR